MKDESKAPSSFTLAPTNNRYEDSDQLFRFRVKGADVRAIVGFRFHQHLESVSRLVQFLKPAFELADELGVRSSAARFSIVCSN